MRLSIPEPPGNAILNDNSVLELHDVFQERNAGAQQDLRVKRWQFQLLDTVCYIFHQLCWW
jgi:hypothetical protein